MSENIKLLQDELIDSMSELNEQKVAECIRKMLDNGCSSNSIMMCLNTGMACVGKSFEQGEYFIGDLIVSGMIYRSALSIFNPSNPEENPYTAGRIIIGVPQGDIHDIGKDIVIDILKAECFEVIDLGVDVKPEAFADAVQALQPDILLLSGVLSLAGDGMVEVLSLLRKRNLRDQVKVLIGGSATSKTLRDASGADEWAYDPMQTVAFCKKVMEEKKK